MRVRKPPLSLEAKAGIGLTKEFSTGGSNHSRPTLLSTQQADAGCVTAQPTKHQKSMARNDIQYKAAMGITTANTANNKLDGTGTLITVLVAAESTTINKVVVKAAVNTTEGMVRLFVEEPGKTSNS